MTTVREEEFVVSAAELATSAATELETTGEILTPFGQMELARTYALISIARSLDILATATKQG